MAPFANIQTRLSRGLGSRGFNWFLASTFVSSLGRNGYAVACAWILVASGDGSATVAAFFAIVSLTELLVSPGAGWISDRFDRRRVFIVADFVRCLAAAIMASTSSAWLICWSAVLFACCDRIALTTSQAMIPMVGKHLASSTSNSVTFFFMQAGGLLAAILVGVLLHITPAAMVFIMISTAFALSVGCMWAAVADGGSYTPTRTQDRMKLPMDPRLVHLGAVYAILYGGGLLVSIMGPGFVFDELSGDALDFGALESAWSAGSIIGAILLIPLARFAQQGFLLIAILFFTALLFASVKLSILPWSLLIFAALGVVYNFGRVAVEVILQTIAPHGALGRAKGLFHCAGVSVGLIIFGLVSLSGDRFSPSTVFLMFSAVVSIMAIILAVFRSQHDGRGDKGGAVE